MSRFSTAAGQRRKIEATKDLFYNQAGQSELLKKLNAQLIKGRTPEGQAVDTSYYEGFGLSPDVQQTPIYDSLTEEIIDPDQGRTGPAVVSKLKSKAQEAGLLKPPMDPDRAARLDDYFRKEEDDKRQQAYDDLIALQRNQERVPGVSEIRPDFAASFKDKQARRDFLGKAALPIRRTLQEIHNDHKEGELQNRTISNSPLSYIKNDGFGELIRRGDLLTKAFLTTITDDIIDKADLKQQVAKDQIRFRDKDGNILKRELTPENSPKGVSTKSSYLEPYEISAHIESQVLSAIDEGLVDSPIARNILGKLKDPYLKDGELTESGREQLIKDYAEEQGLSIAEATTEVDGVLVDERFYGRISLDDRIRQALRSPERKAMVAAGKRTNARTLKIKAEEIMKRRAKKKEQGKAPDPLPFMFILEALHPNINFNELNLKGILFDPDGFNAGILGVNPYIKRKSGASPRRMMIDPVFGKIMSFITEKFLLQTQFIPTVGEAHPDAEALIREGVLVRTPTPDTDNITPDDKRDIGSYLEAPNIETNETGGVTLLKGNSQLGREIFKEWKREQNRRLGRPTDEYSLKGVPESSFEIVGTFARELYAEVNPDLYQKETLNDQTYYNLTDKGLQALNAAARAAPDAFRNVEKMPRLVPPTDFIGERTPTKQTTTVVNRYIRQIEQSRKNMSSIAHKIDTLRSKLMKQAAVQVLSNAKSQTELDKLGDFFGLGPEKYIEFRGTFDKKVFEIQKYAGLEKRAAQERVYETYRPDYEMDKQFARFLEFMHTVGRYSDGAYYLDFVVQNLQGRMHVDQTRFNPQLIPWVRYITGGVEPVQFNPYTAIGDEHNIFKEHMAKQFIPAAKGDLPNEAIKKFDREFSKHLNNETDSLFSAIISEGATVESSLMSDEDNKRYDKLLSEIKINVNPEMYQGEMAEMDPNTIRAKGSSLSNPLADIVPNEYIAVPDEVAQMPPLNIPDSLLARTRKGGMKGPSEGLEGFAKVEAAIELKRYADAWKNKTPFRTNIAIELDGTTHGPSSWLAMLGAIKSAFRSGVLRKEGAKKVLDDMVVAELLEVDGLPADMQDQAAGDLRDGLATYMLENGNDYASAYHADTEFSPIFYSILQKAVLDRDNFLKKPPMTLSYGQLLGNLRKAIYDVIYTGEQATAINELIETEGFRDSLAKQGKNEPAEEVVATYLHNILADAIDMELHPAVVQVGQLLRANNAIAMLSDEIMTVKNALGIDNYIGAKERVVKRDTDGQVMVGEFHLQTEGSGSTRKPIVLYKSEPAGSALRDGIPGGWGRGRIIPAIIQGIDGAWMNLMFRGESWKALEGNYMLPIMDAVKTDLRGAAEVRRQANKNWWKVIEEYDPWTSLFMEWQPAAVNKFYNKIGYNAKDNKWTENPKQIIPFRDGLTGPKYAELPPLRVTPTAQGIKGLQAADLSGPYKGFWYLTHQTAPSEFVGYGELSLQNLQKLIDDTMEFRARNKGEDIQEYNNKKWEAAGVLAKKVAQAEAAKIYGSSKDRTPLDGMSREYMKQFFDRLVAVLDIVKRNKINTVTLNKEKQVLIQLEKSKKSKGGILQVNL